MMISLFDPGTVQGALFFGGLMLLFAWSIGSVLRTMVNRHLDRAVLSGADTTSARFLIELAQILVYVIAFAFYTHLVPSLRSLSTAWLASVGLISVVIGLAAQSTLSNLIAGISVIIYRPFRIGDRVQVNTPAGPEIGMVESIDLGYTSLRTPDGRRVVIPNSIIASQTNINFSRNKPRILLELTLTIKEPRHLERAREILIGAAGEVEKVGKINGCFLTNLAEAGATLMLSLMCVNPSDLASIRSEILTRAKEGFEREGIALG